MSKPLWFAIGIVLVTVFGWWAQRFSLPRMGLHYLYFWDYFTLEIIGLGTLVGAGLIKLVLGGDRDW